MRLSDSDGAIWTMKAMGVLGVLCPLLWCTLLCGQQTEFTVLRADATFDDSSNGSPSAANPASAEPSSIHSQHISQQLGSGNAWLQSGAVVDPVAASVASDGCTQLMTAELTEAPGGGLALRNFSLHGEFTRDHMMMMARNFIPSKPLPDSPAYTPLTSKDKFEGWAHHTYSADMLVGTVFDTMILQATGAYRDYGGGMQGFTKRYGTQLLSNEAGSLFGRWLFPTILHQDPRYFPSRQTNILDRMAYAVSRTVITRSDNGNNVFNSSLILTLLFTSALANGYKPNYEESFPATMANTFAGLGAVAQINLLNEFWPDLKTLFTTHQPTKYITRKVNQVVLRAP
jgi:hypothetical protein